jgi:gas vesicle structural protein
MPVERTVGGTSLIDVLDRVLDKGIVIDAWVRVSLVGIDLITVEARIVVASIDTYLKYSEAVGQVGSVSKPSVLEPARASDTVLAENAALRRQLAASKGGGKRLRRQLAASEAGAKPSRARAAARRRG